LQIKSPTVPLERQDNSQGLLNLAFIPFYVLRDSSSPTVYRSTGAQARPRKELKVAWSTSYAKLKILSNTATAAACQRFKGNGHICGPLCVLGQPLIEALPLKEQIDHRANHFH